MKYIAIKQKIYVNYGPGVHVDIFIPFASTKNLTLNLNSCCRHTNIFCQLGPFWDRHTVGPNMGFNSPHNVQAYNLVMWSTMVIQAIKYYCLQKYPRTNINQLAPK